MPISLQILVVSRPRPRPVNAWDGGADAAGAANQQTRNLTRSRFR